MNLKPFDDTAKDAGCYVDDWPDVEHSGKQKRIQFPMDIFPRDIAEYLEAVAISYNVPVDCPAMMALATTSLAIQGNMIIKAKKDWFEYPQLYTMILTPSSKKKTPVMREVARPVYRQQERLQEIYEPVILDAKAERDILFKQRGTAIKNEDKAEVLKIDKRISELDSIPIPKLLIDDSTSEKIVDMLSRNGGKLGLFSTESKSIENITGRYTEGKADCQVYLQAWDCHPIYQDRMNRESVVSSPSLTVMLCIQPTIIETLQHKNTLKHNGFLPRILFSVLDDDDSESTDLLDNEQVPEHLRDYYYSVVGELFDYYKDNKEIISIPLQGDSRAAFKEYYESFKIGNSCLAEWRGKLRGQVLRIANVLNHLQGVNYSELSLESVRGAIKLSSYLEQHAAAAFGVLEADTDRKIIKRALRWIEKNNLSGFTRREIFQQLKGGNIKKQDHISLPLEMMIDEVYIRTVDGKVYEVNPKLFT